MNIAQQALSIIQSRTPTRTYKPSNAYDRILAGSAKITAMANQGRSFNQIAEKLNVHPTTLAKHVPAICGESVADTIRRNGVHNARYSKSLHKKPAVA